MNTKSLLILLRYVTIKSIEKGEIFIQEGEANKEDSFTLNHIIEHLFCGLWPRNGHHLSGQELWVRVHNLLQRSLWSQEADLEDGVEIHEEGPQIAVEINQRDLEWLQLVKQAIEVAYTIGMQNPTRFSKLYEGRFGKRPAVFFGR